MVLVSEGAAKGGRVVELAEASETRLGRRLDVDVDREWVGRRRRW